MSLFQVNGNLIPGIHQLSISDIEHSYGYNDHRRKLITGLKNGIHDLASCGCTRIYLDGSFITKKWLPNDFDSCWDPSGVDLQKLNKDHPVFFDFKDRRKNQKLCYKGEFFPSTFAAISLPIITYLDFFQQDKNGEPKGIILII